MMHRQQMVTIQGIGRRFRTTQAVAELSLTVNKGELFGIVGPDGSGKTTLLRMIAGVMNPTSGHIQVGGFDTVEDAEAVKERIGYMPQQFGLYPDMSVAANMRFVAQMYGVNGADREQRMAEIYAFTGLAPFKKRGAGKLSGGMKKKLALGCVLMHRPDLLLLDEPTTGVDPVARRDFWDLLSGLHTDGTTTIVSTPYMDEAERCNRVALLFDGTVLAYDTPDAIKASVPGRVLALACADNRAAQPLLHDLPFMLDVQTYGDQLNLIVSGDIDAAMAGIQATLTGQGIAIERLNPVSMRMEEAFIYRVNQARKEIHA